MRTMEHLAQTGEHVLQMVVCVLCYIVWVRCAGGYEKTPASGRGFLIYMRLLSEDKLKS